MTMKRRHVDEYVVLVAVAAQILISLFYSTGPCNDFCLNGGTCFYNRTEFDGTVTACLCLDAFTGDQCEQGRNHVSVMSL